MVRTQSLQGREVGAGTLQIQRNPERKEMPGMRKIQSRIKSDQGYDTKSKGRKLERKGGNDMRKIQSRIKSDREYDMKSKGVKSENNQETV